MTHISFVLFPVPLSCPLATPLTNPLTSKIIIILNPD